MFFLRVSEVAFAMIFVVFMITQVIVPLLANKQMFPIFRREKKQLGRELAAVNEKLDAAEMKRQIKEKEGKANEFEENPAACDS